MVLLAKRLLSLRHSQQLTQEEFARLAGVNYKKYQPVESGKRKEITLSQLEKLAAAYGLAAWELIGPADPQANDDPREIALRREEGD